ncbi:MAG: valine--tRNA ligase [Thermoplasmata archaeon]
MSGSPLAPRFDPATIEAKWQDEWERTGAFVAPERPTGATFSLVLPPPNVTGVLTIGHMLGDTVMDILARLHRMRGVATLWVPGLDHAGLATQVEVRRRLQREGVRFDDLPREEALQAIGRWIEEHERRIRAQTRLGGFSVDWARWRYTMDPLSTRATREAFVALHREGLIYRGERMVNWDPRLRTALSDLEVVHAEEDGELLYLRYEFADGTPGGIEVATVRPETVFGDVAVAVHPDDARHFGEVGRTVVVPLAGRVVPVITDPSVDPAFGAGALKITPRHDLVDREIALRHPGLATPVEIFDDSARLTGAWVPEPYRGLDRDAARKQAIEALGASGALLRRVPYRHAVARSERSEVPIEPRLSTQWFVRMAPLATPVVDAVRTGKIRIHPERWNRTFFRWMEEIQDWCISRQVLWGHPIPVYHCAACGTATASVERPARCPACRATDLRDDPDVLDTWFTSWLWPFAALGWPESNSTLERYYPTSVLVTGRDIMFFWVARMMMAGFRFTGRAPFADVYFTGMLRDEHGRRMSKHLGNSPDPAEVIRTRGADALRFSLVFPNPTDEDGPFGSAALDGARNFLTKLWNLARFTLPHVPLGTPPPDRAPVVGRSGALENRWILARYQRTRNEVDRALDAFEPSKAATALHSFVWHDLADRYLEISKEALSGTRGEPLRRETQAVLLFVLERSLRLLHPFVPHVTEELWHALPHPEGLLDATPWPPASEVDPDPIAEVEMEPVLEAVHLLRNLKADEKVPPGTTPRAWVRPAGPEVARILSAQRGTIARLAQVAGPELLDAGVAPPGTTAGRVAPLGECFIERSPTTASSTETLEREREKLSLLLDKTRGRLADAGFRARAPPEVVREAEGKAAELAERIQRIDEQLKESGASVGTP